MPDFFDGFALIGGLMIGISALLLLFMLGRIAGISGITWQSAEQLCSASKKVDFWRLSFLGGLPLGGLIMHSVINIDTPDFSHASIGKIIISGLLVGFGVQMGSGCTSGHAVCGIARLSPRSITATLVFILTGVLTVYFM